MFGRPGTFVHADGRTRAGKVDGCWRGHVVWRGRKLKADLGPVPWRDDAAREVWTETQLKCLVALNARRAAEEAAAAPAAQPWPATLPEQVRVVAQLLSASAVPLALPAIEAAFKGKGPWKEGLPRILDTLEAVGRARPVAGGWRA